MRGLLGFFRIFSELSSLLRRHRHLIVEMARRDISDRYAGQVFGMIWAFGHPLILMGIYVFVFSVVFKAKIGGTPDMPLDYTAYLIAGLVPWMTFQEAILKSCTVITSNASLVKQVVFPLEVLPIKGVLSSLLNYFVALLVLIVYVLASTGSLSWSYLLLPLALGMQVLWMLGLSFLLAAIGTYFRDIKDFVQVFCLASIYVMPVFYLPQWVPPLFKPVLYVNPFSYMVWCYQDILYFGRPEHLWAWWIFSVLSLGSLLIGYWVFRQLKTGFGNVL